MPKVFLHVSILIFLVCSTLHSEGPAVADQEVSKGTDHVESGKRLLKEEKLEEAMAEFELALAESPENLSVRLILSRIYFAPTIRKPDKAVNVLVDGAHYGAGSFDYVKELFKVLINYEQNDTILELAKKLLPKEPKPSLINDVIAMAAALANYNKYQYDEALRQLDNYALRATTDGLMLFAKIQWERGQKKAVIELLKNAHLLQPNSDRILARICSYARDAGDYDTALSYATRRSINNPLSFLPRLEIIFTQQMAGETAKVNAAAEQFLNDFKSDQAAILALGNFATDNGDVQLMTRIYNHAEKRGFPLVQFGLLFLETHLEANRYKEALDIAVDIENGKYEALKKYPSLINGMKAIGYFGVGENAKGASALENVVSSKDLPVELYISFAKHLETLGLMEESTRLLRSALDRFPLNQELHLKWVDNRIQLDKPQDLAFSVSFLLKMRNISLGQLTESQTLLHQLKDPPKDVKEDLFPAMEKQIQNMRLAFHPK